MSPAQRRDMSSQIQECSFSLTHR
uniref:Uncharacterized protein n=1 Tax=Anguilla anguilla TaxID=7936 RepID=A0A0E9PJK3_ANGAN